LSSKRPTRRLSPRTTLARSIDLRVKTHALVSEEKGIPSIDLDPTWSMRLIEEDGRLFVPGESSSTILTGWVREVPIEISRAETTFHVRLCYLFVP
jgi:hypothetical protein